MVRCYVVIKNSIGCELDSFEVSQYKPIAEELIRVLKENYVILAEGDVIEFISQ